ncbi:hypothetical protein L2E82_22228 [Cichorium intybus]|uniref:Uncharacterized protein n=1 Tax=Cichorium intybus TaxID=13427 RepID=A0ACB9DY70_CICIN|nr:hypothetical protein L2E82_22228 [Cichorium intybus]
MADNGVLPVDKLTISDTVEEAEFSQCVLIKSILGRSDGGAGLVGKTLKVGGWVKKGREQGKGSFAFLELNDGSCPTNLQLITYSDVAHLGQFTPTGFMKRRMSKDGLFRACRRISSRCFFSCRPVFRHGLPCPLHYFNSHFLIKLIDRPSFPISVI